MKFSTVVIACITLVTEVNAFSVSKLAPASTGSNTQLHLLPTQGKQLVAASSTAYNSVKISSNNNNSIPSTINGLDEDDVMVISSTPSNSSLEIPQLTTPRPSRTSARKLVSRLFHLPASLLHHHTESIEDNSSFNIDDDEVLFPIVGFQFVTDGPDHCSVLPTTSNPSCRLHKNKDAVVYGWYTTACKLQCTDENYAGEFKLEGLAP